MCEVDVVLPGSRDVKYELPRMLIPPFSARVVSQLRQRALLISIWWAFYQATGPECQVVNSWNKNVIQLGMPPTAEVHVHSLVEQKPNNKSEDSDPKRFAICALGETMMTLSLRSDAFCDTTSSCILTYVDTESWSIGGYGMLGSSSDWI